MPTLSDLFSRVFRPPALVPVPAPAALPATPSGQPQEARLTTGFVETDNTFFPGSNMSSNYRDRYDYDRQVIFSECLRAWRVNPLARRIVKLISMFVVGEGIQVQSDHAETNAFLQEWWDHPLNHLGRKVINFCDEATRSGNLFFLCTVDQATGMLFVRGVPADQIEEIVTASNDVDQELAYKPMAGADGLSRPPWPAYNPAADQPMFMLHYSYNQPVGVPWGEPDLAPMLPWLGRYCSWLEDRARLNRFRQAFMYVVTGDYKTEAERVAKQNELNANPPPPGSVLVANKTEVWSVIDPQLSAGEAAEDGLSIKKFIAIGAGFPIHYLAEPESSTSTTADAAGTPTFRGLEQTQTIFLSILTEIAQIAVKCRCKFSHQVKPDSHIKAIGPDITERDNATLSLAVARIYPAFSELFDRDGIDEQELLRIVYRMAGEVQPTADVPTMRKRPLKPASQPHITPAGATAVDKVDKALDPAAEQLQAASANTDDKSCR